MADLAINGSNVVPAVEETATNYPHLYKPFKLPKPWATQVYGNTFFDYSNWSEDSTQNGYNFAVGMTANGWKLPQICAILGNICQESTINPGLWERAKGTPYAPTPPDDWQSIPNTHGYGLVQWTPSSDFIPWALEIFGDNGAYDEDYPCWYNGSVQIACLMWELETDKQWGWGSATTPPIRFDHEIDFYNYDAAEEDLDNLTFCWYMYYERPGDNDPTVANRQKWAKQWYDYLKDKPLGKLPVWFIAKAAKNWR